MNTKQPPEPDLQEHQRLMTRALLRSAARRAGRMTMHIEHMAMHVVDSMAARLDSIEAQLDRIDVKMGHIDDAMTKFVDAFRAHQKRVENDHQQ
jgi:hypothetical protein